MRRITAWIYGLLTAALLLFSLERYRETSLQLTDAGIRLAQLNESIAKLASENRELIEQIGEWDLPPADRGSVGEQIRPS